MHQNCSLPGKRVHCDGPYFVVRPLDEMKVIFMRQ
jgi:hypothetical protein